MVSKIRGVAAVLNAGLLACFLLAAAATTSVVVENAYLQKGFYRSIVHLLADNLILYLLPVLGVTVVVAVIAWMWYRLTPYGDRILALCLGLVPALAFFLKVGYDQNRLKFSQYWHARTQLGGVSVPEALTRSDVWLTNILIFLAAVAIGAIVWAICRRGLRSRDAFLRRFWRGMRHPLAMALVVLLVIVPVISSGAMQGAADEKSSFLLISLDALRYDHLGCYGYERDTSPEIDRIAEEGLRFEWAFCQAPTTLPSHMSTLTSLYPTVHGCRMGRKLPGERLTLAEYLREHGYSTAGLVDGGYMSAWYGFAQGFDLYDDRYKGFAGAMHGMFRWLDAGASEGPFFVLMHAYDIHSPYDPPEPYKSMFTDPGYEGGFVPTSAELKRARKRVDTDPEQGHGLSQEDVDFIVDRYDGGIRYVDGMIAEMMDGLDDRDLLDSTWIVITADHGEELAEHGAFLHGMLYMTVARVPLIIRPPAGLGEGRAVTEIVELLDIMPTFLDLAGIEPVDMIQGQSMTSLMEGDSSGWINLAFTEHHAKGGRRSVVSPTLHIIAPLESGEPVVFDYHADPLEQNPLDDPSREAEIEELAAILRDWTEVQLRLAAAGEGLEPAEIDHETIEELRSLGYID